jgi:hypothetical protein
MSSAIDSFVDKIKHRPKFAAAAASDPVWSEHLAAIEFALKEIDRRANDDPAMVEVFDNVVALISDNDRTLRQRLHRPSPISAAQPPTCSRASAPARKPDSRRRASASRPKAPRSARTRRGSPPRACAPRRRAISRRPRTTISPRASPRRTRPIPTSQPVSSSRRPCGRRP